MSGSSEKEDPPYELQYILKEAMPNIIDEEKNPAYDQRNTAYHYYLYEHKILCPPQAYISGIDEYDPDLERLGDHKVRKTGEHTEEDGTHVQSVEIISDYAWVKDSVTGEDKKEFRDFKFEGGWEQQHRDYQRKFKIDCTPEERKKLVGWIGGWYILRKQELKDLRNSKGGITKQRKRNKNNQETIRRGLAGTVVSGDDLRRIHALRDKLEDDLVGLEKELSSNEEDSKKIEKRLGKADSSSGQ